MPEALRKFFTGSLGVDEEAVRLETHFQDDLGADSIDMVSVFMELEDEFKICIPYEESFKFCRVVDVVVYLKKVGKVK